MHRLDRESWLHRIFLDRWHPYAWIIVLGLLLYIKTIAFGFSYLDDQDLIVKNKDFITDFTNIFTAFCHKVYPDNLFTPYYRPILIISFILDAQVAGISPFFYHVTNILLHLIASSLVFTLFIRLGFMRNLSLFSALVFTLHPALSQAVAWVPGRNDSILAIFGITAFIFFLNFLRKFRNRDLVWSSIALLAALLTKESAVILIVLFWIYIVIFARDRNAPLPWKKLLIAQAAVFMLWFIPRYFVIRGCEPLNLFDISNLLIYQIPAVIQLIGKAVFPVNQSVFPTMRESSNLWGLLAIGILITLLVSSRRMSLRMVFFGFFWLVLFLLPPLVRSHAPVVNDVLEHRLYLPIIGLMIIVMQTDLVKWCADSGKRIVSLLAVVVIAALFIKSSFYIDNFRNATSFWENAVSRSQRSAFANLKLAEVYYKQDRLDEAQYRIQEVMRLDFFSTYAGHYLLGHIYLKKGSMDEAEKEFRKTIALMPDNDWAYMSLGVICYRTGRPEEARAMWEKSFMLNPDNFEAAKNLAIYHAEMEDFASARYYVGALKRLGIEPPSVFMKEIGED